MNHAHTQLYAFGEDKFSELSPFLRAVYLSIAVAGRPLHARSIVRNMAKFAFHPNIEKTATPEKTLNARLSENLAQLGEASLFCRTGPAIYSLRHIERTLDELTDYERAWHVPRVKGITSENVLVAPYEELFNYLPHGFTPYSRTSYRDFSDICYFKHRIDAEFDTTVKQFVTYTMVKRSNEYLVYRRGKYSNPSENLSDTYSIAFGGHVTDEDFGLFVRGDNAFLDNSSRELMEELHLPEKYRNIDDINAVSRIIGFINVDDNSDARQHIAVVILINYDFGVAPSGGELGIRDVHWVDKSELSKFSHQFDLWSRQIIDQISGVVE